MAKDIDPVPQKSCPFCGRKNLIVTPFLRSIGFRVHCLEQKCLTKGPFRYTYAKAVAAWDRRLGEKK